MDNLNRDYSKTSHHRIHFNFKSVYEGILLLKNKVDEYVKSDANNVRSMRVLYEGGLISKRKYTSVRNSSDIVKQTDDGLL